MTGFSDYWAKKNLKALTGQDGSQSAWLALFTVVGNDGGTGFTEVSGGGYARTQVAGTVATDASTATSSAVLAFSALPAWVVQGMTVYDVTNSAAISGGQTISSISGNNVTLTGNVNATVNSGDTIAFSAFGAPTGSQPTQTSNGAAVTFPQATANWMSLAPIVAFGLYDAATGGDLLEWDFIGGFAWLPCSISDASPAVFTTHAHGYANGDPLVATQEYGGSLPTVSAGGPLTGYTVNYALAVATDTFELNTLANGGGTTLATSTSGSGFVRKITQQVIPQNVVPQFAAGAFVITLA